MKNKKQLFSLLLALLIGISAVSAQQDSIQLKDTAKLIVTGSPIGNHIALRWSANSASLWQKTNRSGFVLERYTIRRNGQLLQEPEKVVLTKTPLKAQPLEKWESVVDTNNMAGIIAEALYGEKFEVTLSNKGGSTADSMFRLIDLNKELEQRFFVSMYAAELSFGSAVMAAWGYVDETAKFNEEYLYRVFPADELLAKEVTTGSAYTGFSIKEELPTILPVMAKFADKKVLLSWDITPIQSFYTAYQIEKSTDGISFSPLSNLPIMNMSGNTLMYYQDSLAENYKTYYYRFYGLTLFGEKGPYSNVLSGQGYVPLTEVPAITTTDIKSNGDVIINFEFDEKQNALLEGFQLRRSDVDDKDFVPIVAHIAPDARKVVYTNAQAQNYLSIAAIAKNGEETVSFPVFVQPVDSFPPLSPVNLQGKIDTLGVVRLTWQANVEKDLLGYRVFRSYTKEGQLFSLNDVAFAKNEYVDTIDVKNLNRKVYYAVAALDNRYNQSARTPVIEIEKPSLVPPTAPVFSSFSSTSSGVVLQWINSTAADVDKTYLYRSLKDNLDSMVLIKEFPLSENGYTDTDTQYDVLYKYQIKAVNKGGLFSKDSPTVTVRSMTKPSSKLKFSVEKKVQPNAVELTWKVKSAENIVEIAVYRQTDTTPLSLWKVLSGWETSCVDNDVQVGSRYKYCVKLVQSSGIPIYSDIQQVTF